MKQVFPSLRILKPEHVELIRHVFSPSPGQNLLAFGAIVPFPLSAPGHPSEAADPSPLWDKIKQALGPHATLDEGWPKHRGELLLAGDCHPPAGHGDQPVSVSVQAGALHKQLAVFGERRYGAGGRISPPRPFDRMPLTLENAFGGEGHAANPKGKGADTALDAELPNIELPRQLIVSPSDRPEPAGFGPLPHDMPQRARHLGGIGPEWLETRWPHLPLDTDPRFFQAAPADQQLEAFWLGGEPITVRNMHPRHPDLHGRVPALRPRFFIHQDKPGGESAFLELNVHADTLWLLPGLCMGLLIYRAATLIQSPVAEDVNCLMIEFEAPEAPELPIEHYTERLLRTVAPEAFEGIPDLAELQQANAHLSSGELLDKLREQKVLFKQALEAQGIDESAMLQQLLDDPHSRRFAQMIAQRGGSLLGFLNEIEGLLATIESGDADPPAPARQAPDLDLARPAPAQTAPRAPDAPIAPAHDGALRDDALALHSRESALHRLQRGLSCAGLDLSQANLAGMDLAGADFSGAILAGAKLSGASLQGARLQGAHLQGARFDAANMAGCLLAQATLGGASFIGASLQGAILDDSDCTEANFSGADLAGASLQRTQLNRAWLSRTKAAQIRATGADFTDANLEGADFERAGLEEANFSGARLRQASFDHAACRSANFTQADLTNASLLRCDLSSSQATPGTQWQGANLTHAILNDVSWTGAMLDDAILREVQARQADLSGSRLRNAQMAGSDLRAAIFDRADLGHADLSRSNLMEASFLHADLSHCSLEDCNLYAAGFMDTVLEHTRLRGANLAATILEIRAAH